MPYFRFHGPRSPSKNQWAGVIRRQIWDRLKKEIPNRVNTQWDAQLFNKHIPLFMQCILWSLPALVLENHTQWQPGHRRPLWMERPCKTGCSGEVTLELWSEGWKEPEFKTLEWEFQAEGPASAAVLGLGYTLWVRGTERPEEASIE